MRIFDTHCHLYDEQFSLDVGEVIKNAKENNVIRMLVLGDDLINSKKAIKLASNYEEIIAAVGIFPTACYDLDLNETLSNLKELVLNNKKVKCIGEIGLDYYWEKDEVLKEKQRVFFKAQLNLATELNLPVSIHARDSIEDVYLILKDNMPKNGAIMHCFSSSKEMMQKFVDLGCYISLGGPVTFKNAKTPKDVARSVPLDRLLIETDSPYLTPHPYRGQRNEPKYIVNTLKEIAFIKEISQDELAEITFLNATRILGE